MEQNKVKTKPKQNTEKTEKNQILARRVFIRLWQPISGHAVLFVVCAFFAIMLTLSTAKCPDSISLAIIITLATAFYALIALLIVSLIFDLIKISKYNAEQDVYIEYKADVFTLHLAKDNKKEIQKQDLSKVTFANKKPFLFSPYYVYKQTYKLGKISFVLNDENATTFDVKMVPNAQKVYEKINKILGIKENKK